MDITSEQLKKAHSREASFAKRTRERNIVLNRIYLGCGVLFAAGIVILFFTPLPGIIMAVISALVFGTVYTMQQTSDKKNMLLCYHYKTTSELSEIMEMAETEYCTQELIEAANAALSKEKDSRRCGILREVIASASFARGDFDGGYRSLFKDEELFAEDKYFALLYYSGIMEYYLSINSTTGGTEYAEAAYRTFCDIFDSNKRLHNNYAILKAALKCEIYYSFAHGDRPRCMAYVDMAAADSGRGPVTRPTAMLLVKKAECLKFMGREQEAGEIASAVRSLFTDVPYMDKRIKRLIP